MVRKHKDRNITGGESATGSLRARWLAPVILSLFLASCGGQVMRHGHHFADDEIQQIEKGMSRDQVELTLGSPDTTSTAGGDIAYYMSSTSKRVAFMKPTITDRRVVAVYYNKKKVQRVAHYGLKDGKVFDFISRTTPSRGQDLNILNQIFRNFGKAGALLGG